MRKKCIAVFIVAIISAVACALFPSRQATRFTEDNFDSIRIGMTLEEAQSVLGPPGDYRSGPTESVVGSDCFFGQSVDPIADDVAADITGGCPDHVWRGDSGSVLLWFREGRVSGASFTRQQLAKPSPLVKLLRRVGRWWMGWGW